MVLEKSLKSPLDSRDIKPVSPKGNQLNIHWKDWCWKTEAPVFRPPDAKSRLTGKDPDAGKDWVQEKGETEDEMLDDITDSMIMSLSKLWEMVKDRET